MKPFSKSGKAFLALREATGLSQQKFGEEIGASAQSISNIERGLAFITPKQLSRAAKRWPEHELFIIALLGAYETDTLRKAADKSAKLRKRILENIKAMGAFRASDGDNRQNVPSEPSEVINEGEAQ